ncbi:MAG: hypothetical protein U0176_11650 [Bacteroidia bacterium]
MPWRHDGANWRIAFGKRVPAGNTTQVFTVTDLGNTASCSFVVTVQDNEAPVALCQNLTVQIGSGSPVVVAAAQVNNGSQDNCGIAVVMGIESQ